MVETMGAERECLSCRMADEYMNAFPISMRHGSRYNSLIAMLGCGLSKRYQQGDMSSLCEFPTRGNERTLAYMHTEPVLDPHAIKNLFCSPKQSADKELVPEIYIAKRLTKTMTLEFSHRTVLVDRKTGEDLLVRPHASSKNKQQLVVPKMVGSFDSFADADGQSGLFILRGEEHLYTMRFDDSANRVIINLLGGNCISSMHASQKLGEISRNRKDPDSTVRSVRLHLMPTQGVMVSTVEATSNVSKNHDTNKKDTTNVMMPLALYVDSILWHTLGRRVTVRDLDALFESLESIADIPFEDGSLAPDEERARFRHIVQNLHECSAADLPGGGSEPVRFPLSGANLNNPDRDVYLDILNREFFPHVELYGSDGVGDFADDVGCTRLGFLKRTISDALAAMYGFTQVERTSLMTRVGGKQPDHDRMDLRSLRVLTPEHEVFLIIRKELNDTVRALTHPSGIGHGQVSTWGTNMVEIDASKSQTGRKKEGCVDTFFSAPNNRSTQTGGHTHKDAEFRKSFQNSIQKLNLIKYGMGSESDCNAGKRRQHYSFCGSICPSDTPNNANVGREMSPNLASMISVHIDPFDVIKEISSLIEAPLPGGRRAGTYSVLVNGVLVGLTADCAAVRERVREMRKAIIMEDSGCEHRPFHSLGVHVDREVVKIGAAYARVPCVCIRTDGGRLYKGMFRIDKLRDFESKPEGLSGMSIYRMIDAGVIEFLDADEQQSESVVLSPSLWDARVDRHTHADIHPSLLYGTLVSLIPHSKNNHAVKNTNMTNHLKSVMHNNSIQCGRSFERLFYTGFNNQQPVIQTNGYKYCYGPEHPHGYNVLLAISSYKGWNLEDAFVMKRSARDRGLGFGCSSRTKFYEAEPDEVNVVRKHVGMSFKPEEVLMGTEARWSAMERSGSEEYGVVTDVRVVQLDNNNRSTEGRKLYIMTVSCEHLPQPGDKFTSPHAQKGVVGDVADDMDMPYTSDGIRPDVIINPHAIPSRMTVAQLKEMLSGNVAVHTGCVQREFTYDERDNRELMAALQGDEEMRGGLFKMEEAGVKELFDPYTGEPIPARVFIGVCYYSRLKHLVDEKVRSNDVVGSRTNAITRQADVGRKIKGGLKIGEMEQLGITGHGGIYTKQEMFRENSDGMRVNIDPFDSKKGTYIIRPNPTETVATSRSIDTNYSLVAIEHNLNASMLGLVMEVNGDAHERDRRIADRVVETYAERE